MRDKRPALTGRHRGPGSTSSMTVLDEALHGDRATPVIAFMCQCEQPTNLAVRQQDWQVPTAYRSAARLARVGDKTNLGERGTTNDIGLFGSR